MASICVTISEQEVLKLILEFLQNNRLHIAQLALERETGIINGKYTDDVIFLRQLILDGQWDSALDFVEPLKELDGFQSRTFRFLITKYKYFELLCIKQETGPLQDNEFTVEEIVECLKELEQLCESSDEFRQLCALLTLPKLSDHENFRSWNPSSARVECFQSILPIIAGFIDRLNPPSKNQEKEEVGHSAEERLVQLLVKGLLYENAVDYCQAQALEGKNVPKPKCKFTKLLSHHGKLSAADLSLISWLEVLGPEQFTMPFQQKSLDFRMDPLKKPKLEAQWAEHILTTPIKPGDQFPYSLVPNSKLKSAQKLFNSHSMSASLAFEPALQGGRQPIPSRLHSMSQSTFPSMGIFTIQQISDIGKTDQRAHSLGNDAMRQSQIISDMLSESSAPSTARSFYRASSPCSGRGEKGRGVGNHICSQQVAPISHPLSTNTEHQQTNISAARQELEDFCRRNQQIVQKPIDTMNPVLHMPFSNNLPSVPELNTPGEPGPPINLIQQPVIEQNTQQMVQSRLFQEFQTNQQQQNVAFKEPVDIPAQQPSIYIPTMHQQQQQQQPIASIQYPPSYGYPMANMPMPPIAEHFNAHTSQPYQPQQMVMMRNQPQHQQLPNEVPSRNHIPLPMSSRPTSLIIPYGQMQHSLMAQGEPNTGRPRSYLDQPFPQEQSQQQSAATSYSMMTTLPMNEQEQLQQQRKGSLGDEEFEDNQIHGVCDRGDSFDGAAGNLTSTPIRFVPICRYEDAQPIRAIAFHPSGGHFAIGTNSRQLLICRYPEWRAKPNQNELHAQPPEILLARPKQHRGSVYCAAFNQTGELLATGSNDKTIRLMAIQTDSDHCRIGAELELQNVHEGTVRDLLFMTERFSGGSPSNVLVSGGAGNCKLCVSDCVAGQTFKTFQGHTAPILGLNNWGSSTNFVSCSQDKTIRFWDLRASIATSIIWPTPMTSNSPVTSVCVDPNGKLLVSGHEDASIMLYDICGGRVVQLFRPHGDEVRTVRLSNAAYYLLSSSYDKRIVITDMRGNLTEPLAYLPVAEHRDKVIQSRWHPCDFVFLSTSADKSAILWALPPPLMID